MRTLGSTTLALAALACLAATTVVSNDANAQITLPKGAVPTPSPIPSVKPTTAILPVSIASARRTPAKGGNTPPYSTGAIDYDVEISNPTDTALATNLIVSRLGSVARQATPPALARVPVNIPAKGRAFVTFSDAGGLPDGCGLFQNSLRLENGAAAATMKITPGCTFTATLSDSFSQMTDDAIDTATNGKLYVQSVVLNAPVQTNPVLCNQKIFGRAMLRNSSTVPVRELSLRFGLGSVAFTKPWTPADPILPRTTRQALFETGVFQGVPGYHAIELSAPTPAYPGRFGYNITRSCTVGIDIDR